MKVMASPSAFGIQERSGTAPDHDDDPLCGGSPYQRGQSPVELRFPSEVSDVAGSNCDATSAGVAMSPSTLRVA